MPRSIRLLNPLALLLVLAAAMLLAACSSDSDDDEPGQAGGSATATARAGSSEDGSWAPEKLATRQDDPVHPIIINGQLGPGPSRIAFALFDAEGRLIQNADPVTVRLFTLDGDTGTLASEHTLRMVDLPQLPDHTPHTGHTGDPATADSTPLSISLTHEDAFATVYVANAELVAGDWGAELSATIDGDQHDNLRIRFTVFESTSEPAIGEKAPATRQTVLADVDDVAEIDSSTVPIPELHELTVAEAIESGKPVVVAFATPAFCQTRFCGPIMESVVVPVWKEVGDRAVFVHIEPYDLHEARTNGRLVPVPALAEWGLMTEPWVFVLDAEGRVAAKFEGITDPSEVRDALDPLLGAAAPATTATATPAN
jgi:hypothetical protein